MANVESNGHVTDDVSGPERSSRDSNTLKAIKQLEML